MLNLFQHLTSKVAAYMATCPVGSRNKFGMTDKKFHTFALMIVYNETLIVEETTYPEWFIWMKEVHIPAVMATGLFRSYRILRVLDSPNEGITTCIQYNTDEQAHFDKFYAEHLFGLHSIHQQRYENKFVLYNTLMETID